jgi:hypothetical protein
MMDFLMQKEEALLQSIEDPTPDRMKTMVASEALSVDASGVVPVAAFYDIWPQVKVTGHSTSDMQVIALGDGAALVTYKLMQSGTLMGQPLQPVVYATTAWTLRNGTWLAAFHQEVAPAAVAAE